MARRMNGLTYELVGIRDAGDGIMGLRDKMIVKDQTGRRYEFYLGDEQAENFLRELGLKLEDIEGLPFSVAQEKLSHAYHLRTTTQTGSNDSHLRSVGSY